MGILHLILATVLGEFCPLLFTDGGVELTGLIGPQIPSLLSGVDSGRDQCSRNVSVLKIASNFGIIDYSSVNITDKVANAVYSTNWTTVSGSVGSK